MRQNVFMSRHDICKKLERIVIDKVGAHLIFHRGEVLTGRVFKVTSFEDGVATAISVDESMAIQFVVEDLAGVEVKE